MRSLWLQNRAPNGGHLNPNPGVAAGCITQPNGMPGDAASPPGLKQVGSFKAAVESSAKLRITGDAFGSQDTEK